MRLLSKCLLSVLLFSRVCWSQSTAPPSTAAQDLLVQGKQLYAKEGPKPALAKFEEALKRFRESNDRHGEAITFGYIANCYRRLEDLDRALQFANQALQMKEELGDLDEVGSTYSQLGLIYWEKADYAAAVGHFQHAIEIASKVDDKELEGAARNNLGLVFDETGDYARSLEQYQRALELHRASHFERGEGDTLGNIGGVYLLLGRFREALPYYRQALEISERLELKPASSDDLGNLGLCLAGIGEVQEALASFDRAMQVAREASLPKEEADWHKGKATTLTRLGRYDAALREYAAAEQVYERAGLKRELVEALNDKGQVYELLGDVVAANAQFERALELAQTIGNGSGIRSSLLLLGDLERRRKRNDVAEAYFARALESARAVGDEGGIAFALLQRSTNEIERKHYDAALQSAMEASRVAEESGNQPSMALSHYVLGEVRRSKEELLVALDEYAAADHLQQQLDDPELGWRIQYGRGRTLEGLGETDDALAAFKEAVRIIEETRSRIVEERYRAGYMEDRYQAYVALVELLLRLGKPDDAFLYSEKLRARAYLDQLSSQRSPTKSADGTPDIQELNEQIRKLRSIIQKEYALPEKERHGPALETYSTELARAERHYQQLLDNARGPHSEDAGQVIPTTAAIRQILSADTTLIEYVIGKQTLSIFLVTRERVIGKSVEITSESLTSRTELLRALITRRRPEWSQPAMGLRRLLIEPLQKAGYLEGSRQLLLVPDGVLNYVPFAALPDKHREFLGDEFTLAYLPSAAALVRDPTPPSEGRSLLAMAPSIAHLPNSADEVRSIGEIFQRTSRVVAGKQATETLFKQVAGEYDYLHLATHSSLNRNAPALSALELEPDSENDGRLELHEILELRLRARLVTLSACETGLGKGFFTETPAGDEFVGMTRAFLSVGGRNVLASLWAVSDESTRALMIRFYAHLRRDTAAAALAQAQRELRQSNARYVHPYYWSAFVMVGAAK